MDTLHPPRALLHLTVAGRSVPVLPLVSVRLLLSCAGWLAACLLAAGALLEKVALPRLYERKVLAGEAWVRENFRINDNNVEKVDRTPEGVWQSPGLRVPRERRRARRILVIGDSFAWETATPTRTTSGGAAWGGSSTGEATSTWR